MNATEMVAKVLELNTTLVRIAVEGLGDADLFMQPNAKSNSIGWLLWHQARTEDNILSAFSGKPTVWAADKWHGRIAAPGGPEDGGMNNTMAQVAAFCAKKEDLIAYADAVRANSLAVLPAITAETLEQEVPNPPIPVIERMKDLLSVLLADYAHHSGQICYLRGFISGPGWMPF